MVKHKLHFGDPHNVKNSSQVESFRYDPAARVLSVKFKTGGEFHYDGVPQHVVDGFKKAESAGKFLSSSIKGKFKHAKA